MRHVSQFMARHTIQGRYIRFGSPSWVNWKFQCPFFKVDKTSKKGRTAMFGDTSTNDFYLEIPGNSDSDTSMDSILKNLNPTEGPVSWWSWLTVSASPQWINCSMGETRERDNISITFHSKHFPFFWTHDQWARANSNSNIFLYKSCMG